MFFDHVSFAWRDSEIFGGVFKGETSVAIAVEVRVLGGVPVVEKIIMQKRTANKCAFIELEGEAARDRETETGNTEAVYIDANGGVLGVILARLITLGIKNIGTIIGNGSRELLAFLEFFGFIRHGFLIGEDQGRLECF